MIMHLANVESAVTSKKILCIVGISLFHIAAGSFDQFVTNVIKGEGYAHQVVRDIGFMIPDIFQLCFPVWLLRETRNQLFITRPFVKDKSLHKDIVTMFLFVFVAFTLCYLL